jgi:hypothetical protein
MTFRLRSSRGVLCNLPQTIFDLSHVSSLQYRFIDSKSVLSQESLRS